MAPTDTTGQLSWLLDNLVDQVEYVGQALILSRDGLVVAASRGMTPEDSEHLSALAAGLQSLARGAGRQGPPLGQGVGPDHRPGLPVEPAVPVAVVAGHSAGISWSGNLGSAARYLPIRRTSIAIS